MDILTELPCSSIQAMLLILRRFHSYSKPTVMGSSHEFQYFLLSVSPSAISTHNTTPLLPDVSVPSVCQYPPMEACGNGISHSPQQGVCSNAILLPASIPLRNPDLGPIVYVAAIASCPCVGSLSSNGSCDLRSMTGYRYSRVNARSCSVSCLRAVSFSRDSLTAI